jgi:4-alpha-glucanotransferase
LKRLADLCARIGAKLIQILPINDTNDKRIDKESYPYRQVSCFALNPILLDLLAITNDLHEPMVAKILPKKTHFSSFLGVQ